MLRSIQSLAILSLLFFSCQDEKDCNAVPDTSSIDQSILDQQVAEIENYLDSLQLDYLVDPSGVRIVVLEEGIGTTANFCSVVNLTYAGKVIGSSKNFDTAINSNFELDKRDLINGWLFGLFNMKAKGEYRLFVPSPLAYGSDTIKTQTGSVLIPPNSNLEFRMRINNLFNQ